MKNTRRKIIALLVVMTTVATVFIGCGKDAAKMTNANPSLNAKNGTSQLGKSSTAGRNLESLENGLQSTIENIQFSIDGNLFRLPMNYTEFSDKGYEAVMVTNGEVESEQNISDLEVVSGSVKMNIDIKNPTSDPINYRNSIIYKLTITPEAFAVASSPNAGLVGGVTLGAITLEEVVQLYGKPTKTTENDLTDETLVEYSEFKNDDPDGTFAMKLTFDTETKILIGVSLEANTSQ